VSFYRSDSTAFQPRTDKRLDPIHVPQFLTKRDHYGLMVSVMTIKMADHRLRKAAQTQQGKWIPSPPHGLTTLILRDPVGDHETPI